MSLFISNGQAKRNPITFVMTKWKRAIFCNQIQGNSVFNCLSLKKLLRNKIQRCLQLGYSIQFIARMCLCVWMRNGHKQLVASTNCFAMRTMNCRLCVTSNSGTKAEIKWFCHKCFSFDDINRIFFSSRSSCIFLCARAFFPVLFTIFWV